LATSSLVGTGNSTNAWWGAGYTDVHARMPAMTILIFLSWRRTHLARQRALARMVAAAVAVGLWAFVALIIGVLYPTFLQTFKVSPAQATSAPYIARNITRRERPWISNVHTITSPPPARCHVVLRPTRTPSTTSACGTPTPTSHWRR